MALAVVKPPAPVLAVAPVTVVPAAASANPGVSSALAVGIWQGQLAIPGRSIFVGLTVSAENNGLAGSLEIPGTDVHGRQTRCVLRGDSLRFSEPLLGATFTCLVSADGQQLSGTWNQISLRRNLSLRRGTLPAPVRAAASKRTRYETKFENGPLEMGLPAGVWDYFLLDKTGDYTLWRSYDYTTHRVVAYASESPVMAVVTPKGEQSLVLSQSPWFIGNHDALAKYVSKAVYPEQARADRIQGNVVVSFVVDTLGRISDHRIVRGLGHGCDEEALRVSRTFPDTWTPARIGSKAVSVRNLYVISFKLN